MTLEYEYRQRYLEGKEEGREEGRAEGRERTIQKLHERGESIASIADIEKYNVPYKVDTMKRGMPLLSGHVKKESNPIK